MRVIFWILLAVVTLAPLPFASNRPWSWSLLSLIVGLLTVAWGLAALVDPARVAVPLRKLWPVVLPFVLLLGLFALQVAPWLPPAWHHPLWAAAAGALGQPLIGQMGLDPAATVASGMRFAAYGAIFWLAAQTGRDRVRARQAIWTLAAAGFGYAAYGLVVDFSGANTILWFDRWAYEDSVTSTFVNRNAFATYAGLILLVTVGLLLHEAPVAPTLRRTLEYLSGRGGVLLVAAATAGWALLGTDSRGGVLGIAFALTVFVALRALSRNATATRAIAEAGAVATLGLLVINVSGDVALDRLARTVLGEEQRAVVYRDLIDTIVSQPWVGVGLGSFPVTFPMVRDAGLVGAGTYLKAHNGYLEWAFEGGLPALALIVATIGAAAALCVRGAVLRHRDALYAVVGAAAASLVALHSLVDFGPQTPAVAATFALILGLGCAQSWRSAQPKTQ